MHTHIALLRGINVGGHKKIPMADLRALCSALGFANVRTYIQSGNIIFDAPEGDHAATLSAKINAVFGFEVPVQVRTAAQFLAAMEATPFTAVEDITKLHITFLAEAPAPALIAAIDASRYAPEAFSLVGRRVYLHCPKGYGRAKLVNSFWERKLKVAATTRNWKTVLKLVAMSASD